MVSVSSDPLGEVHLASFVLSVVRLLSLSFVCFICSSYVSSVFCLFRLSFVRFVCSSFVLSVVRSFRL